MGNFAQLGCVTQKVLQDEKRDIILIEIGLGKLGALAQGRHNHMETEVSQVKPLQLQALQCTCDSLKENPKGLRA